MALGRVNGALPRTPGSFRAKIKQFLSTMILDAPISAERCAEVVRMRDQEGRGIAELVRLFQVSTSTIRRA